MTAPILRPLAITIAVLLSISACTAQPKPDKPSSILDLSNWKLSVPVEVNHEGHPLEVQQPALDSYSSQFMFTGLGKTDVVFRTPAAGTIQPGSDFPRTELREMTGRGQVEAKWSTRTGTHEMVVEQAVTLLPRSTPDVVVGQIHDSAKFVLIIRLDGNHLYARMQDGKMDTLNGDYSLGTYFTLKIVAGDGSVAVYYNDELKAMHRKNCSSCYFKAGMYLQTSSDTGEATDSSGEVRIRSLIVSHR